MVLREELARLKRQLELEDNTQDSVLTDLFRGIYEQALSRCNRQEGQETPALLAIVRDTAISAYRRRGDEGTGTSGVGGQSTTYEDLLDRMQRELLRANLRRPRL